MATTKDFIRVCNNITLDGQITGDEVYHLAQWLNDHLELCEEWPCNLIFEPLHKVWEDGKVDEAELALVGRILVEIERQWAQRHGSKPATARAATLDDRVPTTQALAPEPSVHPVVRLPAWELDYDPAKPHNRVHPPIHPIAWEILTNARSRGNGTDPLLHYTLAHVDGAEVLLGYKGGDWVEVYAKNGDDHYQRFGFNLGLERWSYSVAPEAEYLISAVIAQKYPTPTA
jgi:sulfite reductase alpha subunit-like flavoprotein